MRHPPPNVGMNCRRNGAWWGSFGPLKVVGPPGSSRYSSSWTGAFSTSAVEPGGTASRLSGAGSAPWRSISRRERSRCAGGEECRMFASFRLPPSMRAWAPRHRSHDVRELRSRRDRSGRCARASYARPHDDAEREDRARLDRSSRGDQPGGSRLPGEEPGPRGATRTGDHPASLWRLSYTLVPAAQPIDTRARGLGRRRRGVFVRIGDLLPLSRIAFVQQQTRATSRARSRRDRVARALRSGGRRAP